MEKARKAAGDKTAAVGMTQETHEAIQEAAVKAAARAAVKADARTARAAAKAVVKAEVRAAVKAEAKDAAADNNLQIINNKRRCIMPGRDRSGPMGQGSMTGRGAGYCAGNAEVGYGSPRYGRGYGCGFGRGFQSRFGGQNRGRQFQGRGFPGEFNAPYPAAPGPIMDRPFMDASAVAKEQETQWLKDQAQYLENALQDIRQRIGALEVPKQSE